jgi:hypothetical protein
MALLSGNFPVSEGFISANFKSNNITKRSQTASGRYIRETNATTLWSVTLATPALTQAQARPIQAYITRCRGGINEFDIILPEISYSVANSAYHSTVLTCANTSAGAGAVDFTSSANNATVIKAGDVVRFSNHTKEYMATTDVTTDGSGNGTLNIEPALIEAVTTSHTITHNAVPFRMIMDEDVQEYVYTLEQHVAFELEMVEVI